MPQTDAFIRTDESFRDRDQQTHHTGISVLQNLPINMVDAFPVDPMHLVYLGTVRKILPKWCNQRRSMKVKISKQMITEISQILDDIAKLIQLNSTVKQGLWMMFLV